MNRTGRYDKTHAVVRADGTEVRPGDIIGGDRYGPVIFRLLTHTDTNPTIVVDEPNRLGGERRPSVYGLWVVERRRVVPIWKVLLIVWLVGNLGCCLFAAIATAIGGGG